MIKRLDRKTVFKFVSLMDSAIDSEKSDVEKYVKTLDLKHIKFKDGETPTFFLATNILAEQRAEILDKHYVIEHTQGEKAKTKITNHNSMMIEYFNVSVKNIEEGGQIKPADKEEFTGETKIEVGAYVSRLSSLGEEEKK